MPTVKANINTSTYVRVNVGNNPVVLQAHRDAVRIVFSDTKPADSNSVYHLLKSDTVNPFTLPFNDTNIWALATSATCSLFVTEFTNNNPSGVSQGAKDVFVTEFGEMTTAQRIDSVAVNFHYGISTKDLTDLSTGTGSISEVGSDAAVQCGAGIGEGRMNSLNAVRYRAGHECITMVTHDQSDLQSGVDVMHGLLNDEDGMAIGSQGVEVGTWFIEGGNKNFTLQDDWTLDKLDGTGSSGFNLDITQRNLFAITFGYLSIAPIRYYIHTGSKGWVEFHNIVLGNTQNVGHLKNPTLPMSCVVRRVSGSGADVQVKSGSWRSSTMSDSSAVHPGDRFFSVFKNQVDLTSIDTGANPDLWHNFITLRSESTFNSKPNHVRAEFMRSTTVVDANRAVQVALILDGTLVGNDAFVSVDSLNSVMSSSKNGTVEGALSEITIVAKDADSRELLDNLGNFIYPGRTASIGVRGFNGAAVTGDIANSLKWREEF